MSAPTAILVSLALFQAASGGPGNKIIERNKALNLVFTDAVNDVINRFNNELHHSPPIQLPDIVGGRKGKGVNFSYAATEGKINSEGIDLRENEIPVKLELFKDPLFMTSDHLLTANIPLSIVDLELQYDTLELHLNATVHPTQKPGEVSRGKPGKPAGAVKAKVNPNKFVVEFLLHHSYIQGDYNKCTYTVDKIHAVGFVVEHIDVDPELGTIASDVINDFKAKLEEETLAATIIEKLIEKSSSKLIKDCKYEDILKFDESLAGLPFTRSS